MKKHILILAVAAAPLLSMAQTTVYNAEVYTIGTKINYRNCVADSLTPVVTSSPAQLWDYSDLNWDSTSTSMKVMSPYYIGTGASYSVHMVNGSDTIINDIKVTGIGNYIVASYCNNFLYGFPKSLYTNGIRTTKTPAHYGEDVLDSVNGTYPAIGLDQTGYSDVNISGYGTLVLPNGTHSNVLLVHRTVYQYSILPIIGIGFQTTQVSYMWYDSDHAMPLMQVDSFSAIGNNLATNIKYLGDPKPVDTVIVLGVNTIVANESNMTANISNNTIVLHDNYQEGKNYELNVANVAGQVVYHTSFTAAQKTVKLNTDNNFAPGMYILSVKQTDNDAFLHIAKAVK